MGMCLPLSLICLDGSWGIPHALEWTTRRFDVRAATDNDNGCLCLAGTIAMEKTATTGNLVKPDHQYGEQKREKNFDQEHQSPIL